MSGPTDVTIVQKPWGHETIWAKTDRYVGKILHIKAGQALSVQYHNMKDETVYLLSGEIIYWVRSASTRSWRREAQGRRRVPHHAGDGAPDGSGHRLRRAGGRRRRTSTTWCACKDRYGREGTSAP